MNADRPGQAQRGEERERRDAGVDRHDRRRGRRSRRCRGGGRGRR